MALSRRHALLLASTALLLGQHAQAANSTWNNTGTDWNTTGDWTGGTPAAGTIAQFTAAQSKQPNISVATSVGEVSFTAAGSSGYDITSTNTGITLTLTGATAIAAANTSGTNTFDAPIVLAASTTGAQAITQAAGGTLVINGVVSQSGATTTGVTLAASGTGVIKLTGANTYTAPTTIAGTGTVSVSSIGNSGANGNLGAGSTINLGTTTTAGFLNYTGAGETTTKTFNLSGTTGGATIDTTGATGALVISAPVTATGAGSKTLTLQGSNTGNSIAAIADDSVTNTTAVTKAGAGTWILSGTNSYTGLTTVSGGTLQLGTGASLSSGDALTTGGTGVFDLNGNSQTVGTLANGATVTNTNGTAATLTFGSSTTSSGSGAFTGNMNIVVNDSGAATNGTGMTANNAGTITNSGAGTGLTTFATVGALASGNVTGITENSGTSALTIGTLDVASGGTTLTNSNGTGAKILTVTNAVAGTGNLILNNNSAIAAGITLSGGANNVGAITNSGTGSGTVSAGAIGTNVTGITQSSNNSGFTGTNLVINSGGTTLTSNGTALLTLTGSVSGSGNLSLVENNTGGITISAANNVGTIISTGTSTGTTTIGGIIGTNVTGVTENSATSQLVLSGTNVYTSGLSILQGTVVANNAAAAGAAATAITLGSSTGGSASLLNNGFTVANVINLGTSAAGTLTLGNNGGATVGTFSGAIGMNGDNLTVSSTGSGGITVSGNVSGTGNLTLSNIGSAVSTLSGASINNTGAITNSASGSGLTTISGVLGTNVTGVIENSSTSSLLLSGTNLFTTGLTVQNGTAILGNAAGAGTHAITLGTGGSASLLANAFTIANNINVGTTTGTLTIGNNFSNTAAVFSGGTVALGANNVTVASTGTGSISLADTLTGSGTLTVNAGAGSSVTLSGANSSFTGTTAIQGGGGTVYLSSATTFGSGPVSIAAGATLDGNTTMTTVNSQTWNGSFAYVGSSGNSTLSLGTGSINVTTPLTLTVDAYQFTVGGTFTNANGVFDITKAGGGSFTDSGAIALGATNETATVLLGTETLSGVISGTGRGITATGSGTLVLNNTANSFTGGVAITGNTTLSVASLANGGLNSAVGASSNAASNFVIDGGTLSYNGGTSGGVSSDRLFTIGTGGATFTESGNRSITLTNTGALSYTGSGARSITLGASGNSANDTVGNWSPVIADGTGGATSLIKNSAVSRWNLNNTVTNSTYTGGTYIYGGVLAATGTTGNIQELGAGNVTVYGGGELQLASLSNLAPGAKVVLNGGTNAYAAVAFGFNPTDANISSVVSSSSTNGVISLYSDSVATTTNALNMANYGDGTLFLGSGGISANNNSATITYGASSLGAGANSTYRLGGGVSINANTLVISNNVLTAGTSLLIGAPGSNNIVQFTASQSSFNGTTTVNAGSLVLTGNSGALGGSAVTLNSTGLSFDDSAAGVIGNSSRTSSLTMNGSSTLSVFGTNGSAHNTTANTVDGIGALAIGTGASGADTITLTPNVTTTSKSTELTATNFSRTAGSTVFFRGTNLGVAAVGTAGDSNVIFSTSPTLSGAVGGSGTTVGVIAGAYGDTSASGVGLATGGLVTYDATTGVRVLASGEYTSAITDGQSTLNNVLYASTAGPLSTNLTATNTTINSLSMTETGTQGTQAITVSGNAGTTLNISSGMIYASQTLASATGAAGVQLISVPTLNFGSTEGVIIDAAMYGGSNGYFGGGLQISSVITGTNGVTVSGAGYTYLTGANTFSGGLTYDGTGRLILGNGAVPSGTFTINGGTVNPTGTASMTGGTSGTNLIINNGTLTGQNGNGGSASSFSVNNMTMNGGSYNAGSGGHGGGVTTAGTLTMNGGSYNLAQTSNSSVAGQATFSGGVFNSSGSTSTGTSYNSGITFNGGLTINNIGTGTYNPFNLGAGSVGLNGAYIALGNGTTVTFNGNSANSNTVSIVASAGSGNQGVLRLQGSNTFNIGDGAAAVDLTIGATLINGSSTGGLVKSGLGTLLLSGGASTYDGGTTVTAGTLDVSGSATLGDTNMVNELAGVTVSGGTLDLGGTTQAIDSLSVSGPGTIQNGSIQSAGVYGNPFYTVSNSTGTATINTNLLDAPSLLGPAPLTKSGAGTAILGGVNTYTGATTVNAGTLIVTGSTAAGSAVAINNGATLGGASAANEGTLNGTVTVASGATGGAINLRDSTIGTLHVGGLTVNGGTLSFDIGTGTSGNLDSIASAGTLTIGGATTITLGYVGGTPTLTNGTYDLITYNNGGSALGSTAFGNLTLNASALSASGKTFTLVNNAGDLQLMVSSGGATATTYTLSTSAVSTLLHAGESTALTTTLTNTGGAGTDTLAYSGVGAATTVGNVTSATISSPPTLANGGGTTSNTNQTLTTAAGTAGVATVSSTGTITNGTIGGAASGTPTGTSVTVYSGLMNYTGSGGTWSNSNFTDSQSSAVHVAPGLDSAYQNTDTVTFGAGAAGTVDLGIASPSLKAVTFNNASSYNLTSTGGGALLLNGGGSNASVTVTSGAHTISAPISLTTSATVTVATGQKLTVSGPVSSGNTGTGLAIDGAGTTVLSNTTGNSYSGPTTISAGKVYLTNASGSATGSGAVGVSGGVLNMASTGSVSGAITLSTGGSFYSGGVASGTPATGTGTGAVLSAALNVNGGNLTFALNTGGAGTFGSPNLNTSYITTSNTVSFTGSDSISLVDLSNGGLTLRNQQPYLLIAASSSTEYFGLVIRNSSGAVGLSQDGFQGTVLGVSTGSGDDYTQFAFNQFGSDGVNPLAATNAANTSGAYIAPYLYLAGGDLEVVPEPSTWALMLGGVALLIVIQRRRRNG